MRAVCAVFLLMVFLVVLYSVVNPPTTIYMAQESRRLGALNANGCPWKTWPL